MKKIPLLIVGMLVIAGLSVLPLQAHVAPTSNTNQVSAAPLYVDELDQKQEIMTTNTFAPIGRLPIADWYYNVQIAQSFVPSKAVLTRVVLDIGKNTSTTLPLTVGIREKLSDSNLVEVSIPSDQIPTTNFSWVECNIPDCWVVPGQTYYIICSTENVSNSWFGWAANNDSDSYQLGCAWFTLDGSHWNSSSASAPQLYGAPQSQPKSRGNGTWDTCFRTYGLPEATLTYKVNMFGLTITNAGNVTAQDLWWNITIKGGILGLINKHANGSLDDLAPGASFSIKIGPVFGLGPITITIQVGGANVKTIEISKTARVILFFILWH